MEFHKHDTEEEHCFQLSQSGAEGLSYPKLADLEGGRRVPLKSMSEKVTKYLLILLYSPINVR